ncbi:MAG: hypothetical protein ACMUJM_01010 [bacterium]
MKRYLCIFAIISLMVGMFFIMPNITDAASITLGPTTSSGEMKSKSTALGTFSTGDKNIKGSGAYGGGNRAFAGSGGSKKGARGAIDGVPDVSGSSKGNTFTTTVAAETAKVGQIYDGSFSIFKGYMSFDTTSLPYDAIVTSASLTLYGKEKNIDNDGQFNIGIYESDWEEPLWNIEWGAITGSEHGAISSGEFEVGQANVIEIVRPYDIIKPGEFTKITLISSRTAEEVSFDGDEYIEYYTSDVDDKNLRPQLDIQYIGADPEITGSLSFTGETLDLSALNGAENSAGEFADFKLEAVYPTLINEGDNHFIFRVRYVYPVDDQANAPPAVSQLWVDLNYDSVDLNNDGIITWNEADFDDPGEKINMQKADPDADDWTNGVVYVAEVDAVGDGAHSLVYQFVFESNSSNEAASAGNAADTMQIEPVQTQSGPENNTCFINSL